VRAVTSAATALAAALCCVPLYAQERVDLAPILELERRGRHQEAAQGFEQVVIAHPANVPALLGLERVLRRLGQQDRVLPYLDSAVVLLPRENAVRSLQLRVLGTLGRASELTIAAERWIGDAPRASDPYREWAFALAQLGDVQGARRVLARGARRLGGGALGQELAQIEVVVGDWPAATRHWHAAAQDTDLGAAAALSLSQAPTVAREAVLNVLLVELRDPLAQRIAADLLVGWGRPTDAWTLLDRVVPVDPKRAIPVLKRFADRAQLTRTPEGAQVRGYALERLARLLRGPEAQQTRIDAARAFTDAGDRLAAERMLEQIALDPSAAPAGVKGAMATLIAVLADAGRVTDAELRLGDWHDRLTDSDVAALGERIARAWIRAGELDRAGQVLEGDSTIATEAIRGWIALFRGDLVGAGDHFRKAGPFAGSRREATDRTSALALIQRVTLNPVPQLGAALLTLERADTSRAIEELAVVARSLPTDGGYADVLVFAGQLAVRRGDPNAAELFEEALTVESGSGPVAPAAEFALAELAFREGRYPAAQERLERLILAYPGSAVVPQARRLLDQVRGAIPRS